jgi:hypothetical protein
MRIRIMSNTKLCVGAFLFAAGKVMPCPSQGEVLRMPGTPAPGCVVVMGVVVAAGAVALASQALAQVNRMPTPAPPPIVQTNPAERYGDWEVLPSSDLTIASTQNASGSAFGVLCMSTCAAFFNFQTTCEQGDEYPALINSAAGSASVELKCTMYQGRHLMLMPLNDKILDSMSIGGELGVAFPLQSGRFQVARFSLTGSLRAADRALAYAKSRGQVDQSKGLRDYTL